MIKVVLIHDDTLLRLSIRQILENTQDIQVVGDADTGHEGIQCTQELQPDVVILSLKLPDISGKAVVARLLSLPKPPKILVISLDIKHATAMASSVLDIGALGYLTPNTRPAELISAIKTVYGGEKIISVEIFGDLKSVESGSNPALHELTVREIEILTLVAEGKTIAEIAERLSISHKSVHAYRSRIYQKLGVNNAVALIRLALREGLVSLDRDND